jgi:hydroxymethylpyrimidine pyrophosphatase-like HAD family hydrolase
MLRRQSRDMFQIPTQGEPMRYLALATDYDGTIAQDGVVDPPTIAALEQLRDAGCAIVLATGRDMEELSRCMARLDLFDLVAAENGALLHRPATGDEWALAEPPSDAFVACLRESGVDPLRVGRCIVATTTANLPLVQRAIEQAGHGLGIVLNKHSLMVLPRGVDKASGAAAALERLGIPPAQTVAVGDAENDLPLLRLCGMKAAVANAVPELKQEAVVITAASRGAGVAELIGLWLAGGLIAPATP